MSNLFLFDETFTDGYLRLFVDLCFYTSIVSAILVITSKNPVVSVLCLVGLFLSVSCYLMLLGLTFIALSYLLVYVGAVSILFLFILMLINVRISELYSDTRNSIPLGVIIGISFTYAVYQILPFSTANFNKYTLHLNDSMGINANNYDYYQSFRLFENKGELNFVTSKTWEGSLSEASHIASIGNIMYTSYSIWLIVTSIILLLAMVGAIVITIKQKS